MASLKQKATSGFVWSVLQRYTVMLVSFVSDIILAGLVSKHIGYKWYTQQANLVPILIASVICAAISSFIVNYCSFDLYADGALKLIIFATLYTWWSLIFKPESFIYTKGIVKPLMAIVIKKH